MHFAILSLRNLHDIRQFRGILLGMAHHENHQSQVEHKPGPGNTDSDRQRLSSRPLPSEFIANFAAAVDVRERSYVG
jgi:hypothetical protein